MEESLGKQLLEKGSEAYRSLKYEEAIIHFEECRRYIKDGSIEILIMNCKKKLKNKNEENKEVKVEEEIKDDPEVQRMDEECSKLIKIKDYYEILGVTKDAGEEDIKRAYKKLAIKFHPDKNRSSLAADAFKKVSDACSTLKDPEKKKFYDQYGTEEEFREKYYQNHAQEEEVDPFDLFFLILNGGDPRRARRRPPHEQAPQMQRVNRNVMFVQLLPFIILILFTVVPYIFQSRPYYQFNRTEEFYKRMTTSINRIDYYIGEKFMNFYTTLAAIRELEPYIEKDYLQTLGNQCAQLIKYKNELEYKLSYYRHSQYRYMIENELRNIDLSTCEKYTRLRDV